MVTSLLPSVGLRPVGLSLRLHATIVTVCARLTYARLLEPLLSIVTCTLLPPEGFERPGYVCKLERNLEGLASAPRAYYLSFDKYLRKCGFAAVGADPCLHYNSSKDLWLLMYCDDLILAGSPASQAAFKKELAEEYEFRDYGEPQSFLGMEVTRDQTANTLHLTQRAYIQQLATQYGLLDMQQPY